MVEFENKYNLELEAYNSKQVEIDSLNHLKSVWREVKIR